MRVGVVICIAVCLCLACTAVLAAQPNPAPWSQPVTMLELTPFNFNQYVGKRNMVVMFYAPWCSACKRFRPDFDELQSEMSYLSDELDIMTANVTLFDYDDLRGPRINVSKVPAVRFFSKDAGPDTTPSVISPNTPWKMAFAVKEKMGLPVPNKCMFGDSEARDVTSNDWAKYVEDPTKTVLVEFFAPWCKHCSAFKSTYNLITARVRKYPKLAAVRVNADKSKDLMARFNVKMLPSFYVFPSDNKTGTPYKIAQTAEEGIETTEQIVKTVVEYLQRNNTLETQARRLWDRTSGMTNDKDQLLLIDEMRQLQTQIWKEHISQYLTAAQETQAKELLEEARGLANNKQPADALTKLQYLQANMGGTEVAKSEAASNMMSNLLHLLGNSQQKPEL